MIDSSEPQPIPPPDSGSDRRPVVSASDAFRSAPLAPIALAATIGLMLDRFTGLSREGGIALTLGGLLGWWWASRAYRPAALWLLWLAFAGLAAVHHHNHRHTTAPDDLGQLLGSEPQLVRLRGIVLEEPVTRLSAEAAGSRFGSSDRDVTLLRVTMIMTRDGGWSSASGRVNVAVERDEETPATDILGGIHAGDLVELVGTVLLPRPPANSGERDYREQLRDRRICGEIRVSDTAAAVTRLDRSTDSWLAGLAQIRGWATDTIDTALSPRQAAVARALLLGDTAAMNRDEWDSFIRTGVVHALAISGQHLVILAGFAWIALRILGFRQARGAWAVMLLIVGYTVLTGMRPSGVRAAVMVTAICGGLVLRRPVSPANSFALAWLVVIALNPTDPFTLGCQLSFLSVFVLIWLAGPWLMPTPRSPFAELEDDTRLPLIRWLRAAARVVIAAYAVTLILAIANAPLLAADQHLVSPIGILIGPPVVLLTSIALLTGFLLLLTAPVPPLTVLFATLTEQALKATGWVVRSAEQVPGGAIYTAGPPGWWLIGFYGVVIALVFAEVRFRTRLLGGLAGWTIFGLLAPTFTSKSLPGELRITFLAVGKGGCTVIETADGRCLLYDAGSTSGPSAIRRVVAPYLWHRGVTRIDEIFLSHADADHFNGLAALIERFPVGQVTMTPSFAEKPTAEVANALLALESSGTPRRLAVIGDRFRAGDVVLEVLHPPPMGPAGSENERSLVLLLRHGEHKLLLTGDLEKAGTAQVLGLPAQPVDVLMAPHHGSRAAFPTAWLRWAEPRFVVVSRGRPYGNSLQSRDVGHVASAWDTWSSGAITLHSSPDGLIAESFTTGERLVIKRGS